MSRSAPTSPLSWRSTPRASDPASVRALVRATGVFYEGETEVAEELAEEWVECGEASGYHFLFAEVDGVMAGYSCFGPISLTWKRYDLYWIATHPDWQGKGIAREILHLSERRMRELGAVRAYVETSSRDVYLPARIFYERSLYRQEAEFKDFYNDGDHKIVYGKTL